MFGEQVILPGLGVILILAFVMPFVSKKVEHNMELFYFFMGLAATVVSGEISKDLILKAFKEPIMISSAVLIAGLLFRSLQKGISTGMKSIKQKIPLSVILFLIVVVLGLISSVITAIIASLVLVEMVKALKMDRKSEISLTVFACLSIGLGAVLTPIGEPLATVAISKLNQDFFYLMRILGLYIIPGIIIIGVFAAVYIRPADAVTDAIESQDKENVLEVVVRALKVYLFVMALVLLGEGFKPIIDRFILGLSGGLLYWINMISAILDNATLTAAEISIKMSVEQITAILMGLLISGVMLIPGNIPNIISASKLKISSTEWAKVGVPVGMVYMIAYFILLFVI